MGSQKAPVINPGSVWKPFFLFLLTFTVAIGSLCAYQFRDARLRFELEQRYQAQQATLSSSDALHTLFLNIAADLRFFASFREAQNFVTGASGASFFLKDKFLSFLKVKPGYKEIFLLDLNGRELLRVETAEGGPRFLSEAELAAHTNYAYLQNLLQTAPGDIYLSPIERQGEDALLHLATPISVVEDSPKADAFVVIVFKLNENTQGALLPSQFLADPSGTAFRETPSPQGPTLDFKKTFPKVWTNLIQTESATVFWDDGLWSGKTLKNGLRMLTFKSNPELAQAFLPTQLDLSILFFMEGLAALALSILSTMFYRKHQRTRIEKRQIETQLVHASKLASIGTLAAGVAHEINNPMAIVLGNLGLIKDKLQKTNTDLEPLQGNFKRIEMAAQRITEIVNGLRTFARSDTDHLQVINVHKVVEDTVMLLDHLLQKEKVQLETVLGAKTPFILGNIGKLQQVIMNLMTNAKDALEDKRDGALIRLATRETDNEIVIEVTDNGTGIEPEVLTKIFDPFFTTKPAGKGTGLGLALCHSMVSGFKGRIEVDSKLGRGTTFQLIFPKSPPPTSESAVPSSQTPEDLSKARFSGKVLVAEDEEEIRNLLAEMIKDLGFEVDTAENGEIAFEQLTKTAYDFAFVDPKMPKMRGEEVIVECYRSLDRKNTRFIVITGGIVTDYTLEQREIIKIYAQGYVMKPFDKDTVVRAILKAKMIDPSNVPPLPPVPQFKKL